MKPQDQNGLLFLIACFGLMVAPLGRGGAGAPPTDAASTQAKADPKPGSAAELETTRAPAPEIEAAASLCPVTASALGGGARPRVVIAMVPDPEQTQLAIYFDQALDALSSSAVEAGWLLDGYSLPWKTRAERAKSKPQSIEANAYSVAVAPVDGAGKEARPRAGAGAKPQPGVDPKLLTGSALGSVLAETHAPAPATAPVKPGALCFRRTPPAPEAANRLIVILVGESPVRGVAVEMLESALALARAGTRIDVVGPFFSGSASGLWSALSEHRDKLTVVTGSATGDLGNRAAGLRIGRTVVSDAFLRDFVAGQIARSMGPETKLALLTESGTSYGAVAEDGNDDNGPKAVFHFPLHIAQLRDAHQRAGGAEDKSGVEFGRNLKFKNVDGESGADTPPAFSELTPLSTELTLRNTLRTIARRRYTHVIVVATDPLDLIFVAREARAYAPAAQLIAFGSSAFLGHPNLSSDLTGMLVASSYPLGLDNQLRGRGTEWRSFKSFDSESAQGVFNALQWILRAGDDKSAFHPLDWNAPDRIGPRGPRPWLSMIDGGALWPLRVGEPEPIGTDLAPPVETGGKAVKATSGFRYAYPTYYAAGFSVCFVIALLMQLLAFWATRPGTRSSHVPFVRVFGAPDPAQSAIVRQYQCVACLILALFAGTLSVCASSIYDLGWTWQHRAAIGYAPFALGIVVRVVLPACGLLLLAAIVLIIVRPAWRWAPRASVDGVTTAPASRGNRRAISLLVVGLTVILSATALCSGAGLHAALKQHDAPLLLIRLADPLGLCPLALLFFLGLGLYLWSAFGLARASAVARFADTNPTPRLDLRVATRLGELRSGFDPTFIKRVYAWEAGVLALFVVPAALLWVRLFPNFEWSGFDILIKALMIALSGAVVVACLQFHVLWGLLSRALKRLAASPMIDAYGRIAGKVTGSFGLQLRSHVPPPAELWQSVQNLDLLVQMAQRIDPSEGGVPREIAFAALGLQLDFERLRAAYGPDSPMFTTARVSDLPCPTPAQEREVHEAFFAASQRLYAVLYEVGRARAKSPVLKEIDEDISLDKLLPTGPNGSLPTAVLLSNAVPKDCQLWIRAAEDFIAMRETTFIYHVLNQIRLLVAFALLGSLMVVCAVFSYPLQPHRFVSVWSGAMLLISAAAALRVIMLMEHNEILGRLARSPSGGSLLKLNLINQVVTYVLLPIAVLAARVFPEFGDVLSSRVEPLMNLLQ